MANQSTPLRPARALLVAALVAAGGTLALAQQQEGFRFRTGVELINVTATVTDASGRFVSGLRQEDFTVYEDGVPQPISHFSNERVPVSLGLVIDTSGSMAGEKFQHAREALDRFLFDLLDPNDEVFLYRFSNDPVLVLPWTTDRGILSRAISRISPRGGTAMYDAVAEAVPLADTGGNRKKAVLIISDGNDTDSRTNVSELKHLVRETEVLVYAIGIDGSAEMTSSGPFGRPPVRIPIPFPVPGGRRTPWPQPQPPARTGGRGAGWQDRVNVTALREITDDSGGRTEIIRSTRDLDPATAGIADELSRQYYLAYPAGAEKDGRWHEIRVQVKGGRYTVRARRGYVAN